jgi:hypothetical protein
MLSTLLLLASAFAGSLCNDGWVSPSTGPGTCSHHGGIAGGGSYYIPPSASSSPRIPTTSGYRPPSPGDELGAWVHGRHTNNYGDPFFSTQRKYTDFSPTYKWSMFDYTCFPTAAAPIGEVIQLIVTTQGGYHASSPAARADESDPYLQVWALHGADFKRIYSWEADVSEDGLGIRFEKKTNNMSSPSQAGGVLYLTQEDIKTIISSDKLIVIVSARSGVEEFEIPMMGAATNIAATRAQCAQAAAAN